MSFENVNTDLYCESNGDWIEVANNLEKVHDKASSLDIKLAHKLMCKGDMQGFLEMLKNYYQAEHINIIDTLNDIRYLHDGVKLDETDIQDDVIVYNINNEQNTVGYVVIKGCKFGDNNSLLNTLNDFIATYIVGESYIQKISQAAMVDKLTGMYNRNEYIRVFNELSVKPPNKLGILFVDINSLKEINDNFGHFYGDNIIKESAQLIYKYIGNYAYRFGGDEFIVMIPDIHKEDFTEIVGKLNEALKSVQSYSMSIGESYRDSNINIVEQIQEAEALMYKRKREYYQETNNDRRKSSRDITRFTVF